MVLGSEPTAQDETIGKHKANTAAIQLKDFRNITLPPSVLTIAASCAASKLAIKAASAAGPVDRCLSALESRAKSRLQCCVPNDLFREFQRLPLMTGIGALC